MALLLGGTSTVLKNIIQSTSLLINKDDTSQHVSTFAERSALKILNRFGCVFLQGRAGSGKSSLGLSLLKQVAADSGREPVLLTFPHQWKLIPQRTGFEKRKKRSERGGYVVMIDDIFGTSNLIQSRVDDWCRVFDIIWPSVESGQMFLVMTSRSEVSAQCEELVNRYSLIAKTPRVTLDVGDYTLRTAEKKKLLMKYVKKRGVFDVREVYDITNMNTSLGFPQCCRFFASSRTAQSRGISFFQNPYECIIQEISALKESDPLGYLVLILVLMKEGNLESSLLTRQKSTSEFRDLVELISDICGIPKPNLYLLCTKMDALCSVYLQRTGDSYQFQHMSVEGALFLDVTRQCPDMCLPLCPARVLVDHVRTESQDTRASDMVVVLQEDDYGLLADRFSQLLMTEDGLDVLEHPALNSETFLRFLAEYWQTNRAIAGIRHVKLTEYVQYGPVASLALLRIFKHDDVISHILRKNNNKLAELVLGTLEKPWDPAFLGKILPSAIFVNHSSMCARLVEMGATPDVSSFRALCAAPFVPGTTTEITQLVLAAGIPWHQITDQDVDDLFCLATLNGNIQVVDILLERAIDKGQKLVGKLLLSVFCILLGYTDEEVGVLNGTVKHAVTVLFEADLKTDLNYLMFLGAGHRCSVAMNVLLQKEVDVNCGSLGGKPLQMALESGKADLVKILLQHGADMLARDTSNNTILHLAATSSHEREQKTQAICNQLEFTASQQTVGDCGIEVIYMRDPSLSAKMRDLAGETWLRDFANERNSDQMLATHIACERNNALGLREILKIGADVDAQAKDGETALHLAVAYSAHDCVKILLDVKADVNIMDNYGDTPLTIADRINIEDVKMLVRHGADVNYSNKHRGRTCLTIATKLSDLETVRFLCNNAVDVNLSSPYGETALHIAASHSDIDTVRLLCEKGSNVNVQNYKGLSMIHKAASSNVDSSEKIHYLIETHHALIGVKDNAGRTAMFPAVESGDLEVVELLKEKGLTVNDVDSDGNTLLHVLCTDEAKASAPMMSMLFENLDNMNWQNNIGETALFSIVKNKLPRGARLLLEHEADLCIADSQGRTPLHQAADNGDGDTVSLLLDWGADANAREQHGQTPLHLVARSRQCMELLLGKGDFSIVDDKGRTPLHIAARVKAAEVVEVLLTRGSSPNTADKDLMTPLHCAAVGGSSGCVRHLLNKSAEHSAKNKLNRTPLHLAVISFSESCVGVLLEYGADMNVLDVNGWSPLHIAIMTKCCRTVEVLLKAGADLEVKDVKGRTVLHVAIQYANSNIAWVHPHDGSSLERSPSYNQILDDEMERKMKDTADNISSLLSHGADTSVRDGERRTALHIAAENNYIDGIKMLMEVGADPHIRNRLDMTPLQTAVFSKHTASVKAFLDRGVSFDVLCADGKTLLHLAAVSGNTETIELLLLMGLDVSACNMRGYTALHNAAELGRPDCVKLLLDNGADVNAVDQEMRSPLLVLVVAGKTWPEFFVTNVEAYMTALSYLIEAGADPLVVDSEGRSPLPVLLSYLGLEVTFPEAGGTDTEHPATHDEGQEHTESSSVEDALGLHCARSESNMADTLTSEIGEEHTLPSDTSTTSAENTQMSDTSTPAECTQPDTESAENTQNTH